MEAARAAGRLPILTGGTGMYFAALTDGLADIPDPGPDARAEARRLLAEQGPDALHASLAKVDPATAARLQPGRQPAHRPRVGGLARHRAGPRRLAEPAAAPPGARGGSAAIRLDPPREALRAAIATRFAAMLRDGAVEEVRALLALDLDPSAAGDARARRAGTVRLSARHAVAGGSRAAHRTGHRPVHQTPGDMVSPSRSCSPDARSYDQCAIHDLDAIFGKRTRQICSRLFKIGIDHRATSGLSRRAPNRNNGSRINVDRSDPVRSRNPSSRPEGPGRRGYFRLSRRRRPADLRCDLQPERHPAHPGAPGRRRGARRRGLRPLHRQGRRRAGHLRARCDQRGHRAGRMR